MNYIRAASRLTKDLDSTLREHDHMCKEHCPCTEIDFAKWNRASVNEFNSGKFQFDGKI